MADMGDDSFSAIMDSLDTAMIVVTTAAGNDRAGCLVGFHAQSSIDPGRYCIWLSKANYTYRVALRATHHAVHFLTASDIGLAEHFGTLTGDETDKFADLSLITGPGQIPVLAEVANRLVLNRTALLDEGGDHVCIAGDVASVHSGGPFTPLRLSAVTHLQPGHSNEERNSPPTERARPLHRM
jgi:flavin reductase (DIM6/NTAB) family NADH-FMN oxidoreductase RutF